MPRIALEAVSEHENTKKCTPLNCNKKCCPPPPPPPPHTHTHTLFMTLLHHLSGLESLKMVLSLSSGSRGILIWLYTLHRCTSKRLTIKDWHLVTFVLCASLLNIVILLAYIIYEGVTTGYDATVEVNVERPFSVDGVRNSTVQWTLI